MNLSISLNPEAVRLIGSEEELRQFARDVFDEHRRILSAGGDAVKKNSLETAVTVVELPDRPPVCVKEFRWRGALHAAKGLFRATQGLRTFRNGELLIRAGFLAARPMALMRDTTFGLVKSEWVIMEFIPHGLELDRYILKRISENWEPEEQRSMVRLFGRYLARLHSAGIAHADLKTCNILVKEDADRIRFFLLDYDDVRFQRSVSWKQRAKNLTQIFLSSPLSLGPAQRSRLLGEYTFHCGIGGKDRRKLAKKVLKMVGNRDILYVGFQGDVRERTCWQANNPEPRL
ncbi:LPS kinase [Desulfomonile tiedjei]|uniref:Lipopolysaccharide kinase (Kdo/WaaP) family n=1 Tax=Desulfomonile tiedjei (strain ATCC 49306 / DSM 6799 / DCB-1) TaxID=706587 RepID=I4C7H2_DESTA|nr:LPS kinase [Desulfomonile tiedjei]AFM25513.1 Lipopolysaccharide kinase (Kdo/WaaP) family [Desulfomonile tiedjei DSM 6799]